MRKLLTRLLLRAQVVQHIIGRSVSGVIDKLWQYTGKTLDQTQPDYEWWDKFRRGKKSGFEIAGNLAQGLIETVTSYVIGRGFYMSLSPVEDRRMQNKVKYTNKLLRKLFMALQSLLLTFYEDGLALGDNYLLVNPDGTIEVIVPNIVTPIREYGKVIGYRVEFYDDDIEIHEEFYADRRERTTVKTVDGRQVKTVETFPNLIGRVPIVHFANDKATNETYGRPFYESMFTLFRELDAQTTKGLQGGKVAGNPMPVFENLENPQETIELNAGDSETWTDEDGDSRTQNRISWNTLGALFLGVGGKFKFAGPPVGFSKDIIDLISVVTMFIQHRTHAPDHVLAGSETVTEGDVLGKNPAWVRYIEGRRDKFAGLAEDEELGIVAKGGLHEFVQVWLRTRALTDSRVYVGATVVHWTDLTKEDEQLTFEKIKWAHSRMQISDKQALELLGLVEDPDTAVEEGRADERPQTGQFDDFGGSDNLTDDFTPDMRRGNGADAPRMPANSGGGRR